MEVQSISIRSFQVIKPDQKSSKPYIQYTIEIGTKFKSYEIGRRYSEFECLYNDLKAELGPETSRRWLPPLPPKSTGLISYLTGANNLLTQPAKVAERQAALERWIKTILVHKELKNQTGRCRAVVEFLELQTVDLSCSSPSKKNSSTQLPDNPFTSQSWLIEHNEIRASVRELRDMLSRRDEILQNQTPDSTSSTLAHINRISLDVKRTLATLNTRLGGLANSLEQFSKPASKEATVLTEGEISRRLSLVSSLQDDCERLGKLTILPQINAGMRLAHGVQFSDAHARNRAELLGNTRPTTRVLGSASLQSQDVPVEETNETRQLDNRQLVDHQLHEVIGTNQEAKLKALTQILLRQKQIGMMINQELAEQNEVLDELNSGLDSASRKLKDAKKKIDVLS
ncbi:hypothetical protein O181_079629 [Austropuccinia psidii MF-1]|uniref:Uncharacterized protein n=1 Tax=Austropuccinia psidii MF-1 TaxID=1389203 RepID=A0A9Q3FJA1_9BASI|nr:hypothetical protein [Austropuccinia psidii MF-1]